MSQELINQFADELWQAEIQRVPIRPLTERHLEFSVEDAYRVQLRNVLRREQAGQVIIGKKIGLTSKAMQTALGVPEPDYGHLFDTHLLDQDNPVSMDTLLQPKVEAEIAFVLAKDLKGPGINMMDVLGATQGVVAAFEVIDSRIADWKLKIQDTVADNASCGRIVLGHKLVSIEALDLRTIGLVLECNGQIIATAAGAEVMGHPAQAVAWLANKLAMFDVGLRKGEVILSGSLTKAFPAARGDIFQATFGGIGTVKLMFDN